MKTKEVEALKCFLQAVGATPDEAREIIRAAGDKDKPVPDKLILTREAAAILECHPKTVFRYRRRGLLNPIRRSARCIRWRESEVRRLAFGEAA